MDSPALVPKSRRPEGNSVMAVILLSNSPSAE